MSRRSRVSSHGGDGVHPPRQAQRLQPICDRSARGHGFITEEISIDGVDIFYRDAGRGCAGDPAVTWFPTSSHMFRHLIPALCRPLPSHRARLSGLRVQRRSCARRLSIIRFAASPQTMAKVHRRGGLGGMPSTSRTMARRWPATCAASSPIAIVGDYRPEWQRL